MTMNKLTVVVVLAVCLFGLGSAFNQEYLEKYNKYFAF